MGLVVMVLGLAVLAMAYFLGRFAVARASGVRGLRATMGVHDDAWDGVSLGRRVVTSVGGFVGYYLGAVALVAAGISFSGDYSIDEASMHVNVAPDGPAARGGMLTGDRVLAIGDAPTPDWPTLKAEVTKYAGQPVMVRIERGGTQQSILVTPGGAGATKGKMLVGPAFEQKAVPLGAAIGRGFVEPFRIVAATGRAFFGQAPAELSGPVAIARETNRVAETGLGNGLRMIAALASYMFYTVLIIAALTVPRAGKKKK